MATHTLPTLSTGAATRRQWRAMGTDAEVIIVAEGTEPGTVEALADLAVQRVEILEQSWSRFRATSELSSLNRHSGRGPMQASVDLIELVDRMQQAWRWTQGACDAAVHDVMMERGYDRDFSLLAPAGEHDATDLDSSGGDLPSRVRGVHRTLAEVVVDHASGTIDLPSSVRIDPGAIGKGLAADIVCREMSAAGATGGLVNLGGDVCVFGTWLDGQAWQVALHDERTPGDTTFSGATLTVHDSPCGIATSTSLRRRWRVHGHVVHHVIDPSTGRSAHSDLVQATVVAPTAWQAEAAATAALVLGRQRGESWLTEHGLDAFLFSPHSMSMLTGGSHVTLTA